MFDWQIRDRLERDVGVQGSCGQDGLIDDAIVAMYVFAIPSTTMETRDAPRRLFFKSFQGRRRNKQTPRAYQIGIVPPSIACKSIAGSRNFINRSF